MLLLKPFTSSVLANDDMLLNAKCSVLGTHRASNARGLPGVGGGVVVLSAGIDSHI